MILRVISHTWGEPPIMDIYAVFRHHERSRQIPHVIALQRRSVSGYERSYQQTNPIHMPLCSYVHPNRCKTAEPILGRKLTCIHSLLQRRDPLQHLALGKRSVSHDPGARLHTCLVPRK